MKFKNIAMASLFLLAAGQSGAVEDPKCPEGDELVQVRKPSDPKGPAFKCYTPFKCPDGQIRLSGKLFGEGCYEAVNPDKPCADGSALIQDGSTYACKTIVNPKEIEKEGKKLGRSNPGAAESAEYFLSAPVNKCTDGQVWVTSPFGTTECMKKADSETYDVKNCPSGKKFLRLSTTSGQYECDANETNFLGRIFSFGRSTKPAGPVAEKKE